jgi:predicted esterase YcpF (UPF0227 family)
MSEGLEQLKPFLEELHLIERNDTHKISYFEKDSDDVIISFSSTPRIGDVEGHEQFIGTLSQNNKTSIFIIDLKNSYGNSLDWDRVASLILPIIKGRRVHAIGYCMGGFLATVLSKYINIDVVVSITPQYSIHPDLMPAYSFLRIWSDQIKEWKIKSLDDYFSSTTKYYILSSEDRDDVDQMAMYPELPNIKQFIFPGTGHDLPAVLDDNLGMLILSCINDKPEIVENFIQSQII